MQDETDLDSLELSIGQAKKTIDLMDSLKRLTNNKDFIKIITEGYFETEASRLVLLKATDEVADEANQIGILKSIDSIGFLRMYLSRIMQFGMMAERALKSDEETREEILASDNVTNMDGS